MEKTPAFQSLTQKRYMFPEKIRTVCPTLKATRNEVDGKVFIGRKDSIISDGSKSQKFTSLWYRTYRYVLLKVKTADQPLVINDIYGVFYWLSVPGRFII
ncbi:MAG: hypothetical protein WDO15_27665 [Bacteroidota bacterium]